MKKTKIKGITEANREKNTQELFIAILEKGNPKNDN